MKGYGTRAVANMLGLSVSQVRSYVRSGFLAPEREGRQLRFSFADLVLLRTAQGLLSAKVGSRRVRRALRRLRQQLPEGRSLAGLHISAEGNEVIVADGRGRWRPESGQTLFDFGVAELAAQVAPMARRAFRDAADQPEELSAEEWYGWGCELESSAPREACEAYERALALDPTHADAHLNLGRLLHESGDARGAERHYRRALEENPSSATAAFNLGVALEDLGKADHAIEAYERAVGLDPRCADAHFNVASLYERMGRPAAAIRHLKDYRKLLRESST